MILFASDFFRFRKLEYTLTVNASVETASCFPFVCFPMAGVLSCAQSEMCGNFAGVWMYSLAMLAFGYAANTAFRTVSKM